MKYTLLLACCLFCITNIQAANPAFSDFNANQFGTAGNTVAIKTGAGLTNVVHQGNFTINGANPKIVLYNTSGGSDQKRFDIQSTGGYVEVIWTSDDGGMGLVLGTWDKTGNFTVPGAISSLGMTNSGGFYNADGTPYVFGGSSGTTNIYETIQVQTNIFTIAKGGKVTITNNFTILTNGTFTVQSLPLPSVLVVGTDGNVTNASLVGLDLSGNTLTVRGGITETLSPTSATNFVVDFTAAKTALITATNDVNWLNSTNRTASTATERSKKVRILASGANRLVTLHSSWLLLGSTTRTFTVTNGTWLVMAMDNAGASETNVFVGATYAQ